MGIRARPEARTLMGIRARPALMGIRAQPEASGHGQRRDPARPLMGTRWGRGPSWTHYGAGQAPHGHTTGQARHPGREQSVCDCTNSTTTTTMCVCVWTTTMCVSTHCGV